MALRDDILRYLDRFGPTTDRKLADAHSTTNQHVNQIARGMERSGEIRRAKGPDGLIQNQLRDAPVAVEYKESARKSAASSTTLLTEDEVKQAVESWLQGHGWIVDVAWGRQHGIDIEAHRDGQRLLIEAKGEAGPQPQQTSYFVGALGELVRRFADPQATYGLALPDNRVYRNLTGTLPMHARQTLAQIVFFVSRQGDELVVELDGDVPSTD